MGRRKLAKNNRRTSLDRTGHVSALEFGHLARFADLAYRLTIIQMRRELRTMLLRLRGDRGGAPKLKLAPICAAQHPDENPTRWCGTHQRALNELIAEECHPNAQLWRAATPVVPGPHLLVNIYKTVLLQPEKIDCICASALTCDK